MDLSGKNILLGITGGIAAYKSAYLLRDFQKAGAEVRVTMTPSATRFVGLETFAALSRHEVSVEVFSDNAPGESWTRHIHWGEWADIIVVAPCTANTLAKLVNGMADNMLTSVVLAARCPLLICPTMDAEMIRHPSVRRNLKIATEFGFHILPSESGYLASGLTGKGRLPEPEKILQTAAGILHGDLTQDSASADIDADKIAGSESHENLPLLKKKVVVSAGPTREFIDPVRYISNPSSGKMGIAMAEAARNLGGSVTLLHGPVTSDIPDGLETESFESAADLFELIRKHSDADVVIMAAAVSDFRPQSRENQKIKKNNSDPVIQLAPNPDSLDWLGRKKGDGQVLIGFAMETENLEKNALAKLEKKNLDWICANELTPENSGFQSDRNLIHLFGRSRQGEIFREVFSGDKRSISKNILKRIMGHRLP